MGMEIKAKLNFEKGELEQSNTLIVQQLDNINHNDVIELSKLPSEQREKLKLFALKELSEDIKENYFTIDGLKNDIEIITKRKNVE